MVLRTFISLLLLLGSATSGAVEMRPIAPQETWNPLSSEALEELVAPIALYPDDLVGIVLPASTFPLQVVQAARFREETPDATPSDRWDDSVVALLNYPEVLKKLNQDLDWTWRLGEAVINQQPDVLAAVAAFRERARAAGNLRSDEHQVVEIREQVVYIRPVSERLIYIPYYDPWAVTQYHRDRVYHYYPQPYPVYYYPYDDDWRFQTSRFWGVSAWYGIGWHDRRLHTLHHRYRNHPYYNRSYRDYGRHRRYRHRDAPAWVNQPQQPAVTTLPPASVWQPGERAGARPFGDRRRHPEHRSGRAPADGSPDPRTRVIRHGSNFNAGQHQRMRQADTPVMQRAPEPVDHQAPEPREMATVTADSRSPRAYATEHEAAVHAAIARARAQAGLQDQQRRQDVVAPRHDRIRRADTPDTAPDAPSRQPRWQRGNEDHGIRRQDWGRRVQRSETAAQPPTEARHSGREAAIRESIPRNRDRGFGNHARRFESPADAPPPPPQAPAPQPQPAWQAQPGAHPGIRIDDIRVEGHP